MRFSVFFKTWALGLTAYALVFTREVPAALAQAPIETDCSTNLDQSNTTYLLNANVTGNCVITAQNITLDGQNLYELTGDINVSGFGRFGTLTIQNMTMQGHVNRDGYFGSVGDLVILDSNIDGYVKNTASQYGQTAGMLTITDSVIVGGISHVGNGNVGDTLITGSTISPGNYGYGYVTRTMYQPGISGSLSIISSDITASSITNRSGSLYITDSTINPVFNSYYSVYQGQISFVDEADITDSTIKGFIQSYYQNSLGSGDITIDNSIIDGDGIYSESDHIVATTGACTITDSTVINPSNVYCSTLALTDPPPELTVTPLALELEEDEVFNPFSGIEAEDSKDGDLTDDIVVVGEVLEGVGEYELVYSVSDGGTALFNAFTNATTTSGPTTVSVIRTVTRTGTIVHETAVGVHKDRKEKEAAQEAALPDDTTALIETLRTTLNEPGATNDPETLKQIIDLVRQLIVALFELMAAQGKLK